MAGPKYCRTLYVSLTLNSLTLCIVVKRLKKLNGYFFTNFNRWVHSYRADSTQSKHNYFKDNILTFFFLSHSNFLVLSF